MNRANTNRQKQKNNSKIAQPTALDRQTDLQKNGVRMEKGIVVLDADKKNCMELCTMLDELNYRIIPKHSLNNLPKFIDDISCQLLILDLDSISVDKNLFRKLKRNNPSLYIVGLSSRPFHPELEEAMSHHIYACLSKPVDEEELVYWIKSLV